MYRHEGLLIYESHDDDGILEVIEKDGVRSLHFGSYPRQSSMRLIDPDKLELNYVRAMTSWLLFKEKLAEEALIIGLGGGSLTKHLLYHFPDCSLKVVEYRKSVVRIARSHFGLPLDPRLKIIIDDGGAYVRQRTATHQQRYSLVIVDAFGHDSMAESICCEAFFEACRLLLQDDGMLVINLWGSDRPMFDQVAFWMARVFNNKTLFVPVQGKGNVIGLGFKAENPTFQLKDLRTRSIELEAKYHIEFPTFLRDLGRMKAGFFDNLIKK